METIVKVQRLVIENMKNVEYGEVRVQSNFETLTQSNVVGLYGQNGSGKTTVVDAFELLKRLISSGGVTRKLPRNEKHLIRSENERAKLTFDFLVRNTTGEYLLQYQVELARGDERLYPVFEQLSYRENIPGKRMKVLVKKDEMHLQIRTRSLEGMEEKIRISMMVTSRLAERENSSFIFHKELNPILKERLGDLEWQLIENISVDFNRDLLVINNAEVGLILTKYIMPFSVYLDKSHGVIPYDLSGPALLPKSLYETLVELIKQTNELLSAIIPGLTIDIQEITEQTMDDGKLGVRFEFLSNRKGKVLPLRTESEGILKIISILSALIAVYNKPNACIVIDELDSGVFEYLLGELLRIIDETGQGQLFFTSHNLRLLEVLPVSNLWFTTSNEQNRYIQLKGVKSLHNIRDVYLRAIQLGGQDEEIYKETKTFHIKRAFRKAGKRHE
ncbi:AAA family ATPase [Lysinibacillus sp. 3P01SB]|uniref:AAA family ATPase n=1 Tax=Lysinibacillus sp. 3P01SB TaxID=3132284 RepID=UPI0039A5FD66